MAFALILYVYIGYPFLLWVLTRLRKAPKTEINEQFVPTVSIFISCYNEADVIEEKINNTLAIDYPRDRFSIFVISDGSDDGTDDIARLFENDGVRIIRQEGRLGKTSAINLAMKECTTDIVVFSDANAMYEPSSIKQLVKHFQKESTGYVVGAALYTDGKDNSAANSEDIYWKYELAIKKMESDLHSVVGGDGAIYAIKRELFIPLDQKDINDFVNPLQIISQGYRGVFEPKAICYEETAGDFDKEYKRKKRIVNRSFRGLLKVKEVMNPFHSGIFSFEVVSHKLLRWLQPVFIVIFALGSLGLGLSGSVFFKFVSTFGIAFLFLALMGFYKSSSKNISKLFFLPYYFIMVNYYSLLGIIEALKGNIQVTWSTPRAQSNQENVTSYSAQLWTSFLSLTLIAFLTLLWT